MMIDCQLQAQHQSELELCKLRHQEQDFEMRQEKMLVDEQLRKVTCSQQETINELKLQHACQLSTVRQNNELQCRQLEDQFQERLRQVRSQLEQRRASDLNELNEHNAKHAEQLKRNHQDALIEMKNYYNDIVMNNMTLITSLKVYPVLLDNCNIKFIFFYNFIDVTSSKDVIHVPLLTLS